MRERSGYYVASRASDPVLPAMWRHFRDEWGVRINSTWIDEAGQGQTADLGELWTRIAREVVASDCLVVYARPEDLPLKGALVEVGMALASGIPVRVVLDPRVCLELPSRRPVGSWIEHPLVVRYSSVWRALGRPEKRS